MYRCMPFPPPGYLWKGVGGRALIELIKLNRGKVEADKEGKKENTRRRKEKRKRKENVEIKQKRPNLQDKGHKIDGEKKVQETTDSKIRKDNFTGEVKQPKKFEGKHDSSGSFCACWVGSLHADVDLLLPCLFQLKKCLDQVLYKKPVCSTPTQTDTDVQEKFKKTSIADEKAEAVLVPSFSQNGSLQIESRFKELVFNWVPPPLENLSSEFNDQDQQWLYDGVSLRNDTKKKIEAINDHLCYPFTMLF
ncbi:hypothetical protein PRUPE_8G165300 [Prunus persica]|uniref:Uncharacterized protein n=1 Tax=Prunus persica TaxID=3760 RepID=A0A251MYV7_PRUPE|nr:uncharacterized protein LOC109950597 [Prunus persica]ONH92246.1 hypothetical protein PRUPE_8G165300 [Prunus persica]